jgi:hypothetical protein
MTRRTYCLAGTRSRNTSPNNATDMFPELFPHGAQAGHTYLRSTLHESSGFTSIKITWAWDFRIEAIICNVNLSIIVEQAVGWWSPCMEIKRVRR